MKRMAALWDNMWFLARETEAEAKGLQTDRTVFVYVLDLVGDI
jgi:hypothetical protein